MKGFDVLKVKSAVKSHNKFDLSRSHLTTAQFGQIIPLLAEETVPGDQFSIDAQYFSRMAPMVVPTYGKFSFKTVNAFVPYHMIAYDAEAWLAGKTAWEGRTPVLRYFNIGDLANFIRDYCVTTVDATADNADFVYFQDTWKYTKFTETGKFYVKVLNALGYAIPQGVNYVTSSTWFISVAPTKLSAMPLLAFFKLYNDYMSQSQRFNTSQLSTFLNNVKYGTSVTNKFIASAGEIQAGGLNEMFSNLKLNYENDYFTSAWQNPNNALADGSNINSSAVPAGIPTGASVGQVNGDNILTQSVSTTINLGQRALDFLKDFDDWVRRNNYSGSRAVQQIYSRFGIKTDDYRSHYAQVISTDSMPITVGDVTSTADAGDAVLGDYAGKGIMNGGKGFSIKVSDYGIILVLGYFTVAPMMAYGYDRKVLRSNPLDFYTPEFDGIGGEAISLGETYENPIADSADTSVTTGVFGYTERYNSYRYGRDQITGDFRNYHADNPMNAWHTGRNLNDLRKSGQLVAQSSSVNAMLPTASQFRRMFSVTEGPEDYFYLTCQFKVDAVRPMMNLNQVTRLGEGDTIVPRDGNTIS